MAKVTGIGTLYLDGVPIGTVTDFKLNLKGTTMKKKNKQQLKQLQVNNDNLQRDNLILQHKIERLTNLLVDGEEEFNRMKKDYQSAMCGLIKTGN